LYQVRETGFKIYFFKRVNSCRYAEAVWEKAYNQLIVKAECVEGAGPVATRDDDKWQIAITLEHLAHIMFGGHFPHYPRQCGGGGEGVGGGLFRDECCDGTSCRAKGSYYFEDTDWLAQGGATIVSDPPTVVRRPPDDLPEEEWAARGFTANSRASVITWVMSTLGVSRHGPESRSSEFIGEAFSAAKAGFVAMSDEERAAAAVLGEAAEAEAAAAAAAAAGAAADGAEAPPPRLLWGPHIWGPLQSMIG
jgi:hypothetical protein